MVKQELTANDKISITCALENNIEQLENEIFENPHLISNATRKKRIVQLQKTLDNIQGAILIDLWKSDSNT